MNHEIAFNYVSVLYSAGENIPDSLWKEAGILSPPESIMDLCTRLASQQSIDTRMIRLLDSIINGQLNTDLLTSLGGHLTPVPVNECEL